VRERLLPSAKRDEIGLGFWQSSDGCRQ
jgi:hypothetical protein